MTPLLIFQSVAVLVLMVMVAQAGAVAKSPMAISPNKNSLFVGVMLFGFGSVDRCVLRPELALMAIRS